MGSRGLARFTQVSPGLGFAQAVFGLGMVLCPLVAFSGLGCAVNPETGGRDLVFMSEEREKEIDAEASKEVEQQLGLAADRELVAYVDAIGQEMASQTLRRDVDYVFDVVEMDEPNAFALPGGHIYVSRGLLALTNSESELANVLSHEIAHVAARHAAQRDARAKAATVLTLLAAVAAGAAGATDVAVGLGQYGFLAAAGLVAAYGRDQERQADELGQDLAAMAGVDPGGMPAFLRQLENHTRMRQGASRLPSFFDTHPGTSERIAETATRAELARWKPGFVVAGDRAAYLERLDGMAVERPASEGVFQGDRFLHADLDFTVRFPAGWERTNQHARVFAVSPRRDALAVLELQGPGEDARAAAQQYVDENELSVHESTGVRIAGAEAPVQAYRIRTVIEGPWGPAAAQITWVPHRGRIYRLSCSTPPDAFAHYEGVFRSFARSFRSLGEAERDSIDELRVRLVRAEPGESLAELGRRVGNTWDVTTTAVMNALPVGAPLADGSLVKVAIREPYRAKPATALEPDPQGPAAKPAPSPSPAPAPGPPAGAEAGPDGGGAAAHDGGGAAAQSGSG